MSQQEQIFIAFMEGVCKKFNCAEAAAPLSDGFKAFCEAVEREPFETWASKQPWTSEYDQVMPPFNYHPGFMSVSKNYIVRRGDKYNVVNAHVAGMRGPTKASPISNVWFDRVEQVGRTPFNNQPKYKVQLGSVTLMMNYVGCLFDRDNSYGKPTSEDELMDSLRKVGYPLGDEKPKNQVEAASYDLSWSSDGEEKPLGKNFSRIDVANTLRNFRDWKTSDQIRNSKPINYKVPTDSHNGPSFHITPIVKLDDTIPVVNTGYHQVDGLAESTKRYVQQLALDKFGIKLEYEDTIGLANRHGDDSGYCGQGFSGIAIDASYESGPVHPSEEFDELAKILKPMGFRHVTSPSESDGFSSSTYHEFVFEPSIHKCDVEN